MSRKSRDSKRDSRAARKRLPARAAPFYRLIKQGVHGGYRKPASGPGKWLVRYYLGKQTYHVEVIATADDVSDADGVAILDFDQAVDLIDERMKTRAHDAVGKSLKPSTVADSLSAYLKFLEAHCKSAHTARLSIEALILPKLGSIKLAELTTERLSRFQADLAKAPARLRSKKGQPQKYRPPAKSPEERRARQNTANRVMAILTAALNRAWRDGKVASDHAWRKLERFANVNTSRQRYLTIAEATRLLNACDSDFRELVHGGLLSGCRYSELTNLLIGDFNPDSGTLTIRQAKAGRPRHVILTDEGVHFFTRQCAGRDGAALVFTKKTGGGWATAHQTRRMADACQRARISPPVGFHGLRHTWASLAIMNGMPLMIAARNLGHRDTSMVEKHYGHLAPGYVAEAVRAHAPRFGLNTASNIAVLGERK